MFAVICSPRRADRLFCTWQSKITRKTLYCCLQSWQTHGNMVTVFPKEKKGFRAAKQARARIKHPIWTPFRLKCEFWALGCPCHQRRADTNIMTLSSFIRYQLEVTSTSLELSCDLLHLAGT